LRRRSHCGVGSHCGVWRSSTAAVSVPSLGQGPKVAAPPIGRRFGRRRLGHGAGAGAHQQSACRHTSLALTTARPGLDVSGSPDRSGGRHGRSRRASAPSARPISPVASRWPVSRSSARGRRGRSRCPTFPDPVTGLWRYRRGRPEISHEAVPPRHSRASAACGEPACRSVLDHR